MNSIYSHTKILTLGVNGGFDITPKWKVGFTTGYDFIAKEFSLTSINIHRDLHCWEMMIDWIPYGPSKRYEFTIRIKSTILKDLKINKKSDVRDNYTNL
jgi:lipopolysaccharide assembly outer membrane protein LptD (OstA)